MKKILLIAPTGLGKTYLANQVKELYPDWFVKDMDCFGFWTGGEMGKGQWVVPELIIDAYSIVKQNTLFVGMMSNFVAIARRALHQRWNVRVVILSPSDAEFITKRQKSPDRENPFFQTEGKNKEMLKWMVNSLFTANKVGQTPFLKVGVMFNPGEEELIDIFRKVADL